MPLSFNRNFQGREAAARTGAGLTAQQGACLTAVAFARSLPPWTSRTLSLPGLILLTPRRFSDARGYFVETYNEKTFRAAGITTTFVQDNQSYSAKRGTVRGLHFQLPPAAQAKLVACLAGQRIRRRGRSAGRIADLRALGRRDADRRGRRAAVRAARLCPRLLHARARHRGRLQGRRLLCAGKRQRPHLERPDARDRLAGRGATTWCSPTRTRSSGASRILLRRSATKGDDV